MNYIKTHREKVSFILVYSLNRFSRTGGNAIFISSELKRNGISILSVAQQIDTDSYSGKLQESIHFIFSQYDNDLRREKCIVGMKEKLRRGEWIGRVPTGYRRTDRRDKRIEFDDNASFVTQVFLLKASNAISNPEISRKMTAIGFKVSNKLLTDMLRNPFYCGYISHKLLDGKIIKGNHESLISEEIFLKVNYIMQSVPRGFRQLLRAATIVVQIISLLSFAGPYPLLIPIQPRPNEETSSCPFPSVLFFLFVYLALYCSSVTASSQFTIPFSVLGKMYI